MSASLGGLAVLVVASAFVVFVYGDTGAPALRIYAGLVALVGVGGLLVAIPVWLNRLAHGQHDSLRRGVEAVAREVPLEIAVLTVVAAGALLAALPVEDLGGWGQVVLALSFVAAVGAAIYANVFGYMMRDDELDFVLVFHRPTWHRARARQGMPR